MRIKDRWGKPGIRSSHTAPEPEGPGEVYRKFERLNGRGVSGRVGGLRELAEGTGKKALYSVFAVIEIAAIVLGMFLDVPFMDLVAFGLPGLLIMFHQGSKDGEAEQPEDESEESPSPPNRDPAERSIIDRILELLGDGAGSGTGDQRRG